MSKRLHVCICSSTRFYFFLEFTQGSLSVGPSICILIISFKTSMNCLNCYELACYYKVYLFLEMERQSWYESSVLHK